MLCVALALSACLVAGATHVAGATPGVSRRSIKIGLHMPFTGAVPIPAESADKGARLLWRWLRATGRPINGRHVRVVVKNDNYNPSQAVAVCKEMVEQDNVFLLSGMMGGSTSGDQAMSCARYAASVGVPYVTVGSYKLGVERLRRYFAVTLPMESQASRLADYLISDRGAKQDVNGIVRFDTPMYRATHDRFVVAMEKRGTEIAYDRAVAHMAGATEAHMVVQEMQALGVENVTILASPVWFLQVLQAANSRDYNPLWTGVGLTMTIGDTVPQTSCNNGDSIDGATFVTPMPSWAERNNFDPTHDRALARVYPEEDNGDSFTWLGWATSQAMKDMLEQPGRRLTRKRFGRSVIGPRMRTGILPMVRFTKRDHFGGNSTHVLKADCTDERWHTVRRFVKDF
jgi:ABC-type branched-subunit amino acid transport system substrate-binding protein